MAIMALQLLVAFSGIGIASGRSLWSSKPATHAYRASPDYLLKTAYPVGNGRLGALPHGPPGSEKAILSLDSLWTGGPFQVSDYRGGNPTSEKYSALPEIRAEIFQNGTGNVDALLGGDAGYGAYQTLGNLTVAIQGLDADYTDYTRSLDLTTGIHTTKYTVKDIEYTTSVFCSYPQQVCVYHVEATGTLPELTVAFENTLRDSSLIEQTCDATKRSVRVRGLTQAGPPEGLRYEAVAKISSCSGVATECSSDGGALKVTAPQGQKSVTIVIAAGTNFDQSKGNAENNYSFKGEDPEESVSQTISAASSKSFKQLSKDHIADYQSLQSAFSLDLPDIHDSVKKETADLIAQYSVDGPGDPFLEALLFDFSRHLLITASRPGSLPANLQGRWTEELWPAWNADYHANINIQMNYWVADQTGLKETQDGLWDYMEQNWVPRGTETAQLLYGAKGWVVHNEMNVFGFTAMKMDAVWAFYPAAPAWMMQHVWDNFEYTQDVEWFKKQGYPLIKGVAEFWLSQLQDDAFSEDGTLVVNPCNSPEHGPTTFGCAHYQQEIHRTFDTVLAGASYAEEQDQEFLDQISQALAKLDKGFHVSEWGGVKEWKLPDSYGYDVQSDHRHLSHLTGWHPGYSVSSYLGGYTNETIQSAVEKTLIARGDGNAGDANAGWGKVWRSAAWARLNNTEQAYWHMRYAIDENFVGNGFSMYSGLNEPFQIDANYGFGGAVLSMLTVDLPLPHDAPKDQVRTVILGPAIPKTWAGGSVKGLRIRGGGSVDFSWNEDGIVTKATLKDSKTNVQLVNVKGEFLG
ncbi:unnamed protein product [Clonostachys chloroleuca]|uniref:Uncharacterized protein n=1 Tax=Clonostachys chloroleuca TaxID=1926264 RepID=A0AA35M8I9_9HYPO|nr:unnamed protein product [Clonostachys chloroleuca]